MADEDLLERYNYGTFVPAKFEPWMNFDNSPALGAKVSDFPLWNRQDRSEIRLLALLKQSQYTVLEFGSFT